MAHLVRDYHPVDVVSEGKVLATGARAFVTTTTLLVYQADEFRNVVLTHTLRLADGSAPRADRGTLRHGNLDLTLDDGTVVWVNRGQGCGCHSPLKIMERPVSW